MKVVNRIIGAISVGIGLLVASTALAGGGSSGGHGGGGHGGGGHGGYGWYGYPSVSFGFGWPSYYYPPSYYYYDYAPTYYYAQPQVVYSSPTVNYEPKRPAQTPADYNPQPTASTSTANAQNPVGQPITQKQTMAVSDIKALAKGGLNEDVILSQIRSNHAVFYLTTAEIIDLKNSGVSEKVIDFMINTANQR